MNVNMYLFFFNVIIEWIRFSLNRQDETLMTAYEKLLSLTESFLQPKLSPYFNSSAGAQFNFCFFLRNIDTWTIDVGFFIHYYFFF